MARRKSLLKEGTIPSDYRSHRSQLETLGSEAAIRSEYSRLRSIIRKRVERMQEAGETTNRFFSRFGDMDRAIPTAKGLETSEMSMRLSAMAQALGGGYTGTVREIREERKAAMERMAAEAEDAGDDETADFLRSNTPTAKQWDKIHAVMGIVFGTVGRSVGSKEVEVAAAKLVLGKQKKSALQMAAEVARDLGFDETGTLSEMKERYRQDGKQRVAWTRAHQRRGF